MTEFEIKARLDTSVMEEQEREWRLRLRQLNRDISNTKLELRRTQLYALGVVGSITGILSVLVSFLPEPLKIVGQAAVNLVQTTIATLTSLAVAYTAGGPWFWVQAIMTGVAIGMAGVGLVLAIQGQQRLDSDLTQFQQGVEGVVRSVDQLRYNLGV